MPACHRCERVQATAELRRTSLGFVCKDNDKWSRCAAIAKELRAKARAAKRADWSSFIDELIRNTRGSS
jgi:hypothetical protein